MDQPTSGGTITVMPNGNEVGQLSNVERATQAARERLASTGTALPAGAAIVNDAARPAAGAAPAAPAADPAAPIRASDGTFAEKNPAELEAERVAREAAAAAETPEQKAAAAAAAAAALAARTPEQIAADDAAAARTVEIALESGAVPIEFDDPAIAETVRERFEVAAQADQLMTQAREQIEEVLLVREAVNVDPVGFVLGEIGTQPAAIEHLVLSLLTQDNAKELLAKVAKIASDPNELRLVKSEQKSQRSEYRDDAQERIAEQRAVTQNLADVRAVCAAMLPNDLTPERQKVAFADMLRDVQQYAIRANLNTVNPSDIPLVLTSRLAALGVDPLVAAQQATQALARSRSGKPALRARSGPTATAKVVAGAPPAPRTGSAFVAGAERRRAIAVPGSGAGSPSASPAELVPPKNDDGSPMSTEQTVAWHRAQLNKGVRHY